MKPPAFVECSVCGREFGSKSILIHERQCLQKLRRTEITPEEPNPNNVKGNRRKKKTATSHKSGQSARATATATVEDSPFTSKQITLPKIYSETASTKSTEPQHRQGVIRPTTATLVKPKFLNLDHIQYDMSLTRIDYKTSTLKLMSDSGGQGQYPSEGLILPSVSVSSLSGQEKQPKKINTEAPSVTKLPQSTLATIGSFFGAPLKKASNTNEKIPLRQSASVSVLTDQPPPLQLCSNASFPLLATHSSAESKRVKATHSTSLLDEAILPQIFNDRDSNESDMDALLTSAKSSINLPSAFRAEHRREEEDAQAQYNGRLPNEFPVGNGERDIGLNTSWEDNGEEDGEGVEVLGSRKGPVGLVDQSDRTVKVSPSELVILKEPVQFSDVDSIASTTHFEFANYSSGSEAQQGISDAVSVEPEELRAKVEPDLGSDLAPNDAPVNLGVCGQDPPIRVLEDNVALPDDHASTKTRSILKNSASGDRDSSLELTPGYFRVRKKFAVLTEDDTGDCDDEDDDESVPYGFARQVSSLTLLQMKPLLAIQKETRNRRQSNTGRRQQSNHQVATERPPQTVANDEAQLVNQLTDLLHEELAKPKKRKTRFSRPETTVELEDKVNDWLATCQPQTHDDPVSVWEGHATSDPNTREPGRPSTSPAALGYHEDQEFGYDTDISRTSSDRTIGDDYEEGRKKVISGLLSAVFRIKDLHKSRTYRFEDRMTVEDSWTDSETEDTVHLRKRTRLETPIELAKSRPPKPKVFGQSLTQKLSSKTLKTLKQIEQNNCKDPQSQNKTTRPQTVPSQWKPNGGQSRKSAPKYVSTYGRPAPIIIQRPVTSPTLTNTTFTSSRQESQSQRRNDVKQVTPSIQNLERLEFGQMNSCFPSHLNSGGRKSTSKATPKAKSNRPLTPRPIMKAEPMRYQTKSKDVQQPPTKSTVSRSSQAPETRSQCVQSSPTIGRKTDSKARSAMKQRPSALLRDLANSPYLPTKSILKQFPKSKLVQFSLNQDKPASERSFQRAPTKAKRPKKMSKPEVKSQPFLDYLSKPLLELNNNKDYRTTHQVYQFETASRFGEPVPVSDVGKEANVPPEKLDTTSRSRDTDSSEEWNSPVQDSDDENSSSDEDFNYSDRQPSGRKEKGENPDQMAWNALNEVEAQQNMDRLKELSHKDKDGGGRKNRFKSTYQLLVPKRIEKDRLIDLNIIVRRHDETSEYPPIEDIVPEFSSDWMYLIVDEVKLTARSPNPYVDTQAEGKSSYSKEHPLKITTSSHSTIGSDDEGADLSKYKLTCYICGHDFDCHEFLTHETDCRDKFLKRNQLLDPSEQEFLPNKPQGTITISTWNRFAQESSKNKRIACPFCGMTFVPTAEKVAEHKSVCQPLPRLPPVEIERLVDISGTPIAVPHNPFLELKLDNSRVSRDVEGSIAAQLRKRFNKKRAKETQSKTLRESIADNESQRSSFELQHKRIVVFVDKERDLD